MDNSSYAQVEEMSICNEKHVNSQIYSKVNKRNKMESKTN